MEIITQAVRVIDYENDRIQKRNVNEMPKFRDYIEQLIGCLLYTSDAADE